MNLRCSYCQTPFTIGRNETLLALQMIQTENLHHYDVHCPHCRRSNQIARDGLEHSVPGWQDALAAMPAPVPAADATQSKSTAKAATPAKPAKAKAPVKKHTPAAAKKTTPAKPAQAKAPEASKPAVKKHTPAVAKKAEAKKK